MSTILRLKIDSARPVMRGHDFYWKVIRELTADNMRSSFMMSEIVDLCNGVKRNSVQCFLRLLVKAEILRKIGADKPGEPNSYELLRRPIETPVLSRNGKTTYGQSQTNMWNTMCYALRGGFKVSDLRLQASTDKIPITIATAKSYVSALKRAGYFIVRGKGVATSYRLKPSAITGPKAPKILKSKMVYDANLQEIVGDVEAVEASS